MLSAGVHHAGWWVAAHREPEEWLSHMAAAGELRLAGPPLPQDHLRALRAWAEARLDPSLPEDLVEKIDDYVESRRPNSEDFLLPLDAWQQQRHVNYWGHLNINLADSP